MFPAEFTVSPKRVTNDRWLWWAVR